MKKKSLISGQRPSQLWQAEVSKSFLPISFGWPTAIITLQMFFI